ncbi:unnamed protein product [Rhizophagus irregularis]|nr:unnamed protein product [Rhizophagus irregularis]CAB4409359.1 unnamed protein product [Rhizophagus irregularis]
MNRWNVALSRAKSKSIIITTNEMLNPDDIEIFADKKISEGLGFLHMVKKWVQENLPLSAIVKEKEGGKMIMVLLNGLLMEVKNVKKKRIFKFE